MFLISFSGSFFLFKFILRFDSFSFCCCSFGTPPKFGWFGKPFLGSSYWWSGETFPGVVLLTWQWGRGIVSHAEMGDMHKPSPHCFGVDTAPQGSQRCTSC